MTIKGTPDPFLPKPQIKRLSEEELEKPGIIKKKSQDEQQAKLIEEGPFKCLPIPLQKKEHESLMPYVGCNENGQEVTLATLASSASTIAPDRRVHIGFSVWFNFDLMAITQPSYGILCDYDNKVMDIYQGIEESLKKSGNRREFATNFEMFLNQNSDRLFGLPTEEIPKLFNIQAELTRNGSWLASEASFQFIRNLAMVGHLLFLNVDITDNEAFFQLKFWLDNNRFELDTLYASNIIEWIKDALREQNYILNLKMVSTPNTRLIQAFAQIPRKSRHPQPKHEPVQHIITGVQNMKLPRL